MTRHREGLSPVLLVTRNFPPLLGGMEGVNAKILSALAEERQVVLCGPRGCAQFAPAAALVGECPVRPLPLFFLAAVFHSLRMAFRARPGLVIAGSGLAAPVAWLAARLTGARFATYAHGLDLVVRNRAYQAAWLPFIRASDRLLVNSRHTLGLAEGRGIRADRIRILNPGADVPALAPEAAAREKVELGLADRRVLLSVGRLTPRKGLVEFIANSLPSIIRACPAAVLVIVGSEASDALAGGKGRETERIRTAAECAGLSANVRFLGRRDDRQLSLLYQLADLHVFPVLALPGDVEGFGMVALESAAHGLRTVAFGVGGVPDAVEEGVTGWLVAADDYPAFASAVVAALREPFDAAHVLACRRFALGKDWQAFGARLRALCRDAS